MRKLKFSPRFMILTLGVLLLMGGGAGLTLLTRAQASNLVVTPSPHGVSTQQTTPAPEKKSDYLEGTPTNITIPSLGINLPVIPGYYNAKTQEWTLTTNKVQYATITPKANNQYGNTFLYGHYRSNVFANLHKIQAGAEVIITTDTGHTFTYILNATHVVDPTDSDSVFTYEGAPILTVQTCTGLFFQNRQLFVFNLVKAV